MECLKVRPTTQPSHIFFSIMYLSLGSSLTQYCNRQSKFQALLRYFGTYNFRIGRATDMALQGVPYDDIQKAGR